MNIGVRTPRIASEQHNPHLRFGVSENAHPNSSECSDKFVGSDDFMLIGIDASRANKIQKTGVEWYSYHLIQELKKIIPDKDVVLYSPEKLRGDLAELPPNWRAKTLSWPPRFFWTQARLSAEMKFSPPDTLFVPSHAIPVFCPKNSFTTIHDIGFLRFHKDYLKSDVLYHKFILNFALKNARKIFTPSEFTKKELIDVCGASPEKITPIPLGYDSVRYKIIEDKEAIASKLRKYGLRGQFFLTVGRLERKKNTLNIVLAFNLFLKKIGSDGRGFKLLLSGLPGYGSKEINYAIYKLGLENKILTPGWVAEDDMPYLLNAASAFVFPSRYEGFGIPILEAMACGTPVITSNCASMPEVADSAAILVNPRNSEEIVEAMIQAVESPELAQNLRDLGLQRVKEFSWAKCAQTTASALLD